MTNNSKILLKKVLYLLTFFLAFLWVFLLFYGILVEKEVNIKIEESLGQIKTIDITKEQYEADKDLDEGIKEIIASADTENTRVTSDKEVTTEKPSDIVQAVKEQNGKAKIALIVTNLGLNKTTTEQALKLPTNITLGFTAYTTALTNLFTKSAQTHETLVYIPFEPKDYPLDDPGPYAILKNNSASKNLNLLENIIKAFPGVKGVYGNFREILSEDETAFSPIANFIKEKSLILLLGMDPNKSYPAYLNKFNNIVTSDYVIDLVPQKELIETNLEKLVSVAKERGYAIGYMDAYPITLEILNKWLENINGKQVELVTLSDIISKRNEPK